MSLYCGHCGTQLAPSATYCLNCGRADVLRCMSCGQLLTVGSTVCEQCVPRGVQGELVRRLPVEPPSSAPYQSERFESRSLRAPLPVFGGALRTMPVISETYQGGRYGVSASVQRPPGDVEILNELGSLVELLHRMANRCTQFVGSTDHTVGMRREMRSLAATIQEEIELRCGSNL